MNAVVEINVGRSRLVAVRKGAGRGAREEVTGRVSGLAVGLGLEDDAAASARARVPSR